MTREVETLSDIGTLDLVIVGEFIVACMVGIAWVCVVLVPMSDASTAA